MSLDEQKKHAAARAADLVQRGMLVGLGTGSTVQFLLDELARGDRGARYVATSPHTEHEARRRGLDVTTFDGWSSLDLAIDGADQVAPDGWLVKGAGGALTREKIVASAATRFIVIVDESKLVDALHPPVPVELLEFGIEATLTHLAPLRVRDGARSPDGGVLGDYFGAIDSPVALAHWLAGHTGVVEHGLFAPALVDTILVGANVELHPPLNGDEPS